MARNLPFTMVPTSVPKIGVPQNGWFTMENPTRMNDLGGTKTFGNTHMDVSISNLWAPEVQQEWLPLANFSKSWEKNLGRDDASLQTPVVFCVRRGHLATLTNDLYNLNRKRIIVTWEALNPFWVCFFDSGYQRCHAPSCASFGPLLLDPVQNTFLF